MTNLTSSFFGTHGFLLDDLDAQFPCERVMGPDLGADTVLQLGDDLAGPGVFLGVGGEEKDDVQVKPDGIAPHLDIAFFQNIKEGHLHQVFQVRQFVHREDAPVHAGDEAEMDGFLAG